MNTFQLASGIVRSHDDQYAIAGLQVIAFLPAGFPNIPGAALSEPLALGSAVTGADGRFHIEILPDTPGAAYACYLDVCDAPGISLRCYDSDQALLSDNDPQPLDALQETTLHIRQTDWTPGDEDWQQLANAIAQGQLLTLDALAGELAGLAPLAIFRERTAQQRLGFLGQLENGLLDPDGLLLQSGIPLSWADLQDEDKRNSIAAQIRQQDNEALTMAFNNALQRMAIAGGHPLSAPVVLHQQGFLSGDFRSGVGLYLGNNPAIVGSLMKDRAFLDRFPWLRNPLNGYRDYLVDIWVKRATQQIPGQGLDANGAVQQLINRFHQDFRTGDAATQSANKICITMLLHILQAPTGNSFGFGIAAASIDPQGERSHREYLDYLLSLTRLSVHEMENRYRVDFSRADTEDSSAVQQNIDTLQRFFTDSFQSRFDPVPILPPLSGNGLPIINDNTFPKETRGPFFWEYEEWLERNDPFYAENYFDIRRCYKVSYYDEDSKKAITGRTVPYTQFINYALDSNELRQFTPAKTVGPNPDYTKATKIGDQWARNLVELYDLLEAAHKDFFAGLYSSAELQYMNLTMQAFKLQTIIGRWKGTDWDVYNPAKFAAEQRAFIIKDPEALDKFETKYHLSVGYWLNGNSGQSWLTTGTIAIAAYLVDLLKNRLLPGCLAETRQAIAKYRESIQGGNTPIVNNYPFSNTYEVNLTNITGFPVFTGASPFEPGAKKTPDEQVWWFSSNNANAGSLPFATNTAVAVQEQLRALQQFFPAHAMEKAYFALKLGDVLLEWADYLYRSNLAQNIQRARELYKGVLFLHGEDPDIEPLWGAVNWWQLKPIGLGRLVQNPLLTTQINRAQIGFTQINAGLNFYGYPKDYTPPVRYRVLREAALSFAAAAKNTQNDYLKYMQQYEQAIMDEMAARTLVEKAGYSIQVAAEQEQIAQFGVGEANKQVAAVKGQIAAKRKEIADADSFFSQLGDFLGGMKDAAKGLGESAMGMLKDDSDGGAGGSIDYAAMYKVISSKGGTSAATAGLTGGMAIMAGYGAFVYAGYTSMSSMEAAAAKRAGDLKSLEEVALPAAEKMVELKQREVKIAGLQKAIAQADYDFGKKLLAFYDYRFLSKAFWQQLAGFANRLLKRYLDLGGRTAWFAERALSFATDKDIRIVSFDYFPKTLRGVTGADSLQLHLAEMEATRIYSLSQTIPVKHTLSMARDFPIAFGQLKKNGSCAFATSETLLRLAYPGVYGYRLRCVSVGATYADDTMPHKGMLSNHGISMVSRNDSSMHRLARYPDALPLSEFNMRDDMQVYDLPDETLLPFEGSGIETFWNLRLSQIGDATSLQGLTDILISFDMRASYSAALDAVQQAALPGNLKKSLLISGKAQNPGSIKKFKKDGGSLVLHFMPAKAAANTTEKNRTNSFIAFMLSGVEAVTVNAHIKAETDGTEVDIVLNNGIDLSNAGFLAAANGGVALPLNDLTAISTDQVFTVSIDPASNAGIDFSKMVDLQMLVEYQATF